MLKQKSIVSRILDDIKSSKSKPLLAGYSLVYKSLYMDPADVAHAIWNLKRSGVVSIYEKNNRKFIKLTKKGELKILLEKAKIDKLTKWDGKWRLVIFDIPEGSRELRGQLRRLLRETGFEKLQASVFVSPHPLNGQAIEYLKKSKLISFIRMLRVDAMDNDSDLKKKFKIK